MLTIATYSFLGSLIIGIFEIRAPGPGSRFIVIFLDFHSTKQGLSLVDSWSRGLDQNQMYPDHDTPSNVPRSGNIIVRDQSMVESGVKGGLKHCQFSFS